MKPRIVARFTWDPASRVNQVPIRIKLGPPRNHSRVSALLGSLVCLLLCATGLFIFFSGGELIGGIPWLPDALNRGIGRALLVLGIVLTGLLAVYALWEAWTLHRQRGR